MGIKDLRNIAQAASRSESTQDQQRRRISNRQLRDRSMPFVKKKVNLVIRRLIDVDRILVTVGESPKSKKEQGNTLLAVHPNYEVS